MDLNLVLGIYILLPVFGLANNIATEIINCNYEDTVNLTSATQLQNGSYLYDNVLITPDLVGLYNYDELSGGKRIPVDSHSRGCMCRGRNCIKFCCHTTNEQISNYTRHCSQAEMMGELNKYINVTYKNGTIMPTHAMEGFVVLQGVPCEGAYPLFSEEDDDAKWDLFENGTLFRHYDKMLLGKRDYCFQPIALKDRSWILNPMICPVVYEPPLSIRLNCIAMVISLPFLVLTIFVYLIMPELRNLHGKCFISYLISLTVGYIILSTITLSELVFDNILCKSLGYVAYFACMSAFFWLSVISFNSWLSIRNMDPISIDQRKRFLIYSTYAWGLPLFLTFMIMIIQNLDISDDYKPGIGGEYCWLKTNDWSAMIYFYGINLGILLLDTVFFIMASHRIIIVQRKLKEISKDCSGNERSQNLRLVKNNVGLFMRLLIIMGLSWLFDIFSYIENQLHPNSPNPLYFITDLMNAMTGILIFISFVLRGKVLKQMKKRFQSERVGMKKLHTKTANPQLNSSQTQLNVLLRKK